MRAWDGLGGGFEAVLRQPDMVSMVERAKNAANKPKISRYDLSALAIF
jgi:hypothetical protein